MNDQKTVETRDEVPRDAVRIISGFSEEVAIAVTQPLWPAIEPRKRSDSDIVGFVAQRRVDLQARSRL